MRRALAIDEASLGADHPNVAPTSTTSPRLLRATNRLAEAEPLVRRALAIDEASLGADHPAVAIDLNNLASCSRTPTVWRRRAADAPRAGDRRGELGRRPPGRSMDLNNLAVAPGHQPAGGGRTADAPRAGHRRGELGPTTQRAILLNNLALMLSHQPSGGGRTADASHGSGLHRLPTRHRPPAPASRRGDPKLRRPAVGNGPRRRCDRRRDRVRQPRSRPGLRPRRQPTPRTSVGLWLAVLLSFASTNTGPCVWISKVDLCVRHNLR